MSCDNQRDSLSFSADPHMKWKRGRPGRDKSVQGDDIPVMPASGNLKKNRRSVGTNNTASDDVVGQKVYGVIEGSFDAGYLLHVKVADTNTHLRGVVFLPGRFTPITAANDVAPHVKMYKRKEISIPFVNPQGQLSAVISPSGKSEKPVEHKNGKHNLPDQCLQTGLQSGATAATESQSASILIPPASNLRINDTGLSLGQKFLQEQNLDSGLQNDNAVGGDHIPQRFEAFKLMKAPIINVEAPKASEPVSAAYTATLPAAETVNLKPQVEHQAVSSNLKPLELVHDDVKIFDLGNNQTPKISEPEPEAVACEPTGINMYEIQALSRQDIDISQDTRLELDKKTISGDDAWNMDGLSASDDATATMTAPFSASMNSLPKMIIGADTIPTEPKPPAEEFVLPRMIVPEVSGSLRASNTTNSVESNVKDATPPAQS